VGFVHHWVKPKTIYNFGICYFSAKRAALSRSKNKNCLAQNWDNVFECCNISISGLSFQWATTCTIKIQLAMLV